MCSQLFSGWATLPTSIFLIVIVSGWLFSISGIKGILLSLVNVVLSGLEIRIVEFRYGSMVPLASNTAAEKGRFFLLALKSRSSQTTSYSLAH